MAEAFSEYLREALLVDAWGGWRSLDRAFLQRLCERMQDLADGYVAKYSDLFVDMQDVADTDGDELHENCAHDLQKAKDEADKALKTMSALGCVRV